MNYPGAQSSNLLNGTIWILFPFRLISGEAAAHDKDGDPDHKEGRWCGGKIGINPSHIVSVRNLS